MARAPLQALQPGAAGFWAPLAGRAPQGPSRGDVQTPPQGADSRGSTPGVSLPHSCISSAWPEPAPEVKCAQDLNDPTPKAFGRARGSPSALPLSTNVPPFSLPPQLRARCKGSLACLGRAADRFPGLRDADLRAG